MITLDLQINELKEKIKLLIKKNKELSDNEILERNLTTLSIIEELKKEIINRDKIEIARSVLKQIEKNIEYIIEKHNKRE